MKRRWIGLLLLSGAACLVGCEKDDDSATDESVDVEVEDDHGERKAKVGIGGDGAKVGVHDGDDNEKSDKKSKKRSGVKVSASDDAEVSAGRTKVKADEGGAKVNAGGVEVNANGKGTSVSVPGVGKIETR